MRTDAKIGFAIGGVLLAVIVVYLLVVPRHRQVSKPAVVLVTPNQSGGAPSTPVNNSESNSVGNGSGVGSGPTDKTAPGATLAQPPMTSSLPTPGSNVGDSSKTAPAALASNEGKSDGSNWEKLFAGSTQLPTTPAEPSHLAAGSTPAMPPAGEGTSRSTNVASSAVNGGVSTSSLNIDHGNAAAAPQQYTVRQGQTLSSIAADVYGNARYYVAIIKANPNLNPNRLRPGTHLVLPDISDVKPAGTASASAGSESGANEPRSLDSSGAAGGGVILASEAAPPTEVGVSSGRVYAVQKGDTLYRIAKRLYGSTAEAKVIYSLNQDVIGPNAAKLKLGMILHLPDGAVQ